MRLKILAFMQNQWFKNPAAVRAMFERHPYKRNEIIKRLLFAGCVSGQRLRAAFGMNLCNAIIWEEASPQLAGQSSGAFEADLDHIVASIRQHDLDAIICFGKIASDAIRQIEITPRIHVFHSPHPASRGCTVEMMRNIASRIISEQEPKQ